jgi:streptogramin lyase
VIRKVVIYAALNLSFVACANATPTIYVGCIGPSVDGSPYGQSYVETISPSGTTGIFTNNLTFVGGIAFDSYGNLDVTEQVGMADTAGVIRIDPNGIPSAVTDVNVGGIAFCETTDLSGNIYIGTSTMTGGITRVTPAGIVSNFSLVTLPGNTGSNGVQGMIFNTDGNLYATSSEYILQIQPNGTTNIFAAGNLPSGGNTFIGLTNNSSGDLFATDFDTGQVDEIAPSGEMSIFASGLNEPEGITIDSVGDLYVAGYGDGTIDEISPAGVVTQYASDLNQPEYIAIAPVPLLGAVLIYLSNARKMHRRTLRISQNGKGYPGTIFGEPSRSIVAPAKGYAA